MLDPGSAFVLKNRGAVLHRLGRFADALADAELALAQAPHDGDLHLNRGNALLGLKRYSEALAAYARVAPNDPGAIDAAFGSASALRDLGRRQEALQLYVRVLASQPSHFEALIAAAALLTKERRQEDALGFYDRAIAAAPSRMEGHQGRAAVLFDMHRAQEALDSYERAYACDPDAPLLEGQRLLTKYFLCSWDNIENLSAQLIRHVAEGKHACDPFTFLTVAPDANAQWLCARQYASRFYPAQTPLFAKRARKQERIRIGYVSGEMREQATAYLTAGLFEEHDRAHFACYGYSTGKADENPMRKRLMKAFDAFADAQHISDENLAARIAADEIDILVNLNGYFGAERTGVFALKPAPLQVNYLGFPGTDRKSTRLNSSHVSESRMPSSA